MGQGLRDLHRHGNDVQLRVDALGVRRSGTRVVQKSTREVRVLNQTFPFTLVDIANMVVLRGILNRLWLQIGPLIARVLPDGRTDHDCPPLSVLAAIEAKDPAAAERAIAGDTTDAGKTILDWLVERRNFAER